MNCQTCKAPDARKVCSKCSTEFYCSTECQTADWDTHKQVCRLWEKKHPGDDVLNNPWYSADDTAPEVAITLPCNDDHPLLIACKSGQAFYIPDVADKINATDNAIYNARHVSIPMGRHGECPLHFAVIGGNLAGVQILLNAGAYVNSEDSRGNTPLYYACTHPGVEDKLTPEMRLKIAVVLVNAGADTLLRSPFSGLRPAEAARSHHYDRLARFIESSAEKMKFEAIREHLNDKDPPEEIAASVRMFVDLTWRMRTVEWHLSPDGGNCCPHPQIAMKSLADAELALQDCARRHRYWWQKVMGRTDASHFTHIKVSQV